MPSTALLAPEVTRLAWPTDHCPLTTAHRWSPNDHGPPLTLDPPPYTARREVCSVGWVRWVGWVRSVGEVGWAGCLA
jgi:hypothetical protein